MALRDTIIQQGSQTVTTLISGAIRGRRTQIPEPARDQPRPALQAAEELLAQHRAHVDQELHGAPSGPLLPPAELFADVEGYDEIKDLFDRALRSEKPVHILLVGPPGSGKSQLLQCVAKLPHSRYAVGGATTSSGLVAYLLEKPGTRYLIIDELDKADPGDLYALYSLMESGMVTRLQHGASEQTTRTVWVFAAANTADPLPPALASRFVRRDLAPYTQEETRRIAERVLVRREGLPKARAAEIARATAARSRDPRDAVQVARLAGRDGDIGRTLDQVVPQNEKPAA
jgi:Holliday junction DNA helicase RuvB